MNASATSGYQGADPPTPAPARPTYSVRVLPKRSTTSGHYVCWNIDASENREFFVRNAKQVGPILRLRAVDPRMGFDRFHKTTDEQLARV
jgi:hypothetical protein